MIVVTICPCGKQTHNPKYCSRDCCGKYTAELKRKKLVKKCKSRGCQTHISINKVYCLSCRKNIVAHNWLGDMTLRQAISINRNHPGQSPYTLIRSRARSIGYQKLGMVSCYVCGYDKHVEIAHRKPICSYSLTTLISVINRPSNLVALCPNCHWEFDHNRITKIPTRKRIRKYNRCPDCNKVIRRRSRRCIRCSVHHRAKDMLKIEWPAYGKLRTMVNNSSMNKVAKLLGVSPSAVSKHLKNPHCPSSR